MKDVILGLKCCAYPHDGESCGDCPYNYESQCIGCLAQNALDILTKLRSENESLKAELGAAQLAINSMKSKLRAAGLYAECAGVSIKKLCVSTREERR